MSAIRTHPEITPQRPHCVAGVGGFESHTPCNRCVRFATTVASGHATLATKRTLRLTWAGLSPAGSHQLCLAHSFDHLVSDCEHARWYGEGKRFGGLQIYQ